MTDLFLRLFNMSISASWIVLAVIILRLLLKKAPRWVNVALWGFVGIRLVLPFSFKSILSVIPSSNTIPTEITETASPYIESGFTAVNQAVNPVISTALAPNTVESISPMEFIISAAAIIWLVGVGLMLLYTFVSYLTVYRFVKGSSCEKENIFRSARIDSPFIMGIIKPKIYLPEFLNSEEADYVIAHEKAHIKRRDYLWKPLAFALLSVYWYNPLMWVGYILLCRDIEYACDEKVIKQYGEEHKAPYSKVLIECSIPRKAVTACPVAFGEVGIKSRIKNILSYKKPSFWIIAVSLVLCVAIAVCFLTDPLDNGNGADFISKKDKTVQNLEDEVETSAITEIKKTESIPQIGGNIEATNRIIDISKEQYEIIQVYLNEIKDQSVNSDDVWLSNYKTYNDGTVGVEISCIKHPNFGDDFDTVIAGHKYKYTIGYYEYRIYKNGKLYSFVDAYKNGVISKKVVDEFFESKQIFNENVELNGLSKTDARKIINDYIDGYEQDFCNVILKYNFSLSDSTKVIMINRTDEAHAAIIIEDYIANQYLYKYSGGGGVTLYKNGKFCSLKSAYDNGLISKSVLDEFFKKCPNANSIGKYITEDDILGELSLEKAVDIKVSYDLSILGNRKNNIYVKYKNVVYTDVQLTYCGRLSDNNIMVKLKVKKPIEKETTITEEVLGYKYEHLYSDVAMIHSTKEGGILMDIGFAYERNYVSKTEVDKFFEKLNDLK